MDPDDVVGFEQRTQARREALVDAVIGGLETPVEIGDVEPVMHGRPERPVGVTGIEIGGVFGGDVDGDEADLAGLLDLELALSAGFAHFARPAEPQSAGLAQHIDEGDGEPAGLGGILQRADAVRDDHETGQRLLSSVRSERPARLRSRSPSQRRAAWRR